jgi:exosortase A-associated hydrolase 2
MIPGKCSIKADFLEHRGRSLFYLLLEPAPAVAHCSVLFLPPFADEMNKSRRMVACQARALADAGFRVMLLDLSGCGDSGGDFVDASWNNWLQDAEIAARFLMEGSDAAPVIWGLRMGALLACGLAHGRPEFQKLLLWQPVLNGEQQVDQFLRLRTVPTSGSGEVIFDRKSLWDELRAGRSLDIAGYELSSTLALEMARARLNDLRPEGQVHWLEIGMVPHAKIAPGSENVVSRWREQGASVETSYVHGDPFWRTVDAEVNIDLLQRTLDALSAP